MKTIKITEDTHRELTEIQTQIYREQGVKLTFNELLIGLTIIFKRHENEHK